MNFQRYLSAKRTVDDRALNRRVEDRLAEEVEPGDEVRVLEVGAGIGATVVRLLDRPWLPDRVTYTGLDLQPENVVAARQRLPNRAAALGYAVRSKSDRTVVASPDGRRVEIDFRVADAFEFIAERDREWDLLVAQAFVDLVDPADALVAFREALAPGGVAYCPITYDGETVFEPEIDREFEDRLLDSFHSHVDESGDSRAGRRLLSLATESGEVLAAGGSDWVVRPRDAGYPADEAYFLDCIVEMVAGAVQDDPSIEDRRLSDWATRRRNQITDAELMYCAHQLDLLIR